jgi:hypothetical protein
MHIADSQRRELAAIRLPSWGIAGVFLAVLVSGTLLVGPSSSSFGQTGTAHAQQEGEAWSTPVNLSNSLYPSMFPDVAVDRAGNVYVVWSQYFRPDDGGWGDAISFAMRDGNVWSKANDIYTAPPFNTAHLPAIAVDSRGLIHLIWLQGYQLLYGHAWSQREPWNTLSWSEPQGLSQGDAYWNDIVVDGRDRIHVVWAKREDNAEVGLAYARSVDGGETWSEPMEIVQQESGQVMLASDGKDGLYVIWVHVRGKEVDAWPVYFSYSQDAGQTWSEPLDLAESPPDNYEWPNVAVDGQGTVHLVFYRSFIGSFCHRIFTPQNGTWSDLQVVKTGLVMEYGHPGLAIDSDGRPHMVVPTSGMDCGVFHTSWDGQAWSPMARVSTNTVGQASHMGRLAIGQGNQLHVVWFDFLEGSAGGLWEPPRGRVDVFYSTYRSDAHPTPPVPLPAGPTATPRPQATTTPKEAAPTPTATAAPRRPERGGDDAATQPVRSPIALGIGMSVGLTTVVAFLWSIARHSQRYR